MQDWVGAGLMAVAAAICAGTVLKRRRQIRTPYPPGAIRPEFAAMGEMVRPLLLFVVGLFAAKFTLFYFLFSAGHELLSPLEFAGVLVVLAAYAVHIILTVRTRPVERPNIRPATKSMPLNSP
jgi:hypothetical protein